MTDNPENTRGTQPQPQPQEQPSNNSKNTNREPQSTSQAKSHADQTNPSLSSRIQTSAAGLARSAFQGGAGDIPQALSNLSDGKNGGSSSATARAGGQGYLYSNETSTGLRTQGSAGYAGQTSAESFRESNSILPERGGFSLPDMTAEEFQRGDAYTERDSQTMMSGAAVGPENVHVSSRSSLEDLQGVTGSWKGKARAQDPMQLDYNTAWERAGRMAVQPQSQSAQPVSTDGAAVVSLLSEASFDPNFDPGMNEIDIDPAASPAPLTASEIETLELFRRQIGSSDTGVDGSLQQQPQQQQQQQFSGQSLIPDIDTFLQQNDPGTTQVRNTSPDSVTTLRDNVLANLPGAADWVTVQERYHDEVWGYLRPALEAAKAEMDERGGGDEGHGKDGPAVRRLKMILKHMKA